jgi:exodeoxyribonuclease VII large subunit
MEVLTVGEVSRYINNLLRSDPILAQVWIRGEISNLSRSAAGHFYFTLRDESSQLKCVLFRGAVARLGIAPERGAAVVLHGNVAFYEAGGACEVCVDLLYPEGVGLAQLELEALKLKLEAEGLFAPERKRPLPPFPHRIGLVTSGTGAVLHDVLQVLGRRYPLAEVVLAPTTVQGERAPAEICAALDRLARLHEGGERLDVVIVARGGGSEQELAIFNDERVARAFFGCPVPIVSAIGHETDFTLVDYVADLRAPTPSAAAELVAPDAEMIRELIGELSRRARGAIDRLVQDARFDLEVAYDRLLSRSPAAEVARCRAELKAGLRRAASGVELRVRLAREQVRGRTLQLEALSPERTIGRGYAVLQTDSGLVVRSIQQVVIGESLDITVRDGAVRSRAESVRARGLTQSLEPGTGEEHGVRVSNI